MLNAIKGLGEEVDESMIVQKVLISLPMRFDPKKWKKETIWV
jgi:hypothetical protein